MGQWVNAKRSSRTHENLKSINKRMLVTVGFVLNRSLKCTCPHVIGRTIPHDLERRELEVARERVCKRNITIMISITTRRPGTWRFRNRIIIRTSRSTPWNLRPLASPFADRSISRLSNRSIAQQGLCIVVAFVRGHRRSAFACVGMRKRNIQGVWYKKVRTQ